MEERKIITTKQGLNAELKKNSLVPSILYTLLVCILASFLVFSYLSLFSSKFYIKTFDGKYLVGVNNSANFVNTKNGQLLSVQKYSCLDEMNPGDELYYSSNAQNGSGIVFAVDYAKKMVTIFVNDKQEFVSFSSVVGKVSGKTDGIGYFVWFIQSYHGVIFFNVVLVLTILIRTIVDMNIERSPKGKELKERLKKERQTYKQIKRTNKNYDKTNLDVETCNLLGSNYQENKVRLVLYAKNKDLSNAYKYVLSKVHEAYLGKSKLTNLDKERITNCIELMLVAKEFDMDVEYLLTDLILKTELVKFDTHSFSEEACEYVINNKDIKSLENFVLVLYVLVKNNKQVQNQDILEILNQLEIKINGDAKLKKQQNLLEICLNIKKFIQKS